MSNLFRNSSPGALTREQAVELEKKRFAERNIQQSQNPTASLSPNSLGFGGVNQPNTFAGADNTQPPNANKPAQQSEASALDRFLASMSKSDLQGLKSALNNAVLTTGLVELAVGTAFVVLNPSTLLVTVTIGGLVIAQIGFTYFANKIDEYLSKQ